jgi:DNA-binding LytR/AlgR family response regulator
VKIRIETEKDLLEDEIIIRCREVNEAVDKIQRAILEQFSAAAKIVFYKGHKEFYFPLSEVLFFETENDGVYAHTKNDSFSIRHRLYELMDMLPARFMRVSKSAILNIDRTHSITRNLASASLVEFEGTYKHVYVSRRYYASLKERLAERR